MSTLELNPLSHVNKVYAVVSGKGGVGKSLVTSMLAVGMQRRGLSTAILDADITGPSIPTMFGVHGLCDGMGSEIYPKVSKMGTRIVSVNNLLESPDTPVIWRGPAIAGLVSRFWTDVIWGDVDTMFIDMPPGTGDVPLTVFQSIPLDGIIIVATPQQLVSTVVSKAINMAREMNVPIMGMIYNMSHIICPDCNKKINLFGSLPKENDVKGLPVLAEIPLDSELSQLCDNGCIELFEHNYLENFLQTF